MKRNWHLALLGISAAVAAGCGADTDSEMVWDEGEVASVQQKEVFACPAEIQPEIPTIKFGQELLIIDKSVVNDEPSAGCRTEWNLACDTLQKNHWHFWYLMQQMAGTNNVTKFVGRFLQSIESWPHPVNGQMLSGRPAIRTFVLKPWMNRTNTVNGNTNCNGDKSIDAVENVNCQLDPGSSPFRLLAVVNRTDLRLAGATGGGYGTGRSGEGRIVFGFVRPDIAGRPPLQGTVIFEYALPTQDFGTNPGGWTTAMWATEWHKLGQLSGFGTSFNSQLQKVTDQFALAGKNPGAPNLGSAISQVRVDERDFDDPALKSGFTDKRQWSLREFKLGCYPGVSCTTNTQFLVPVAVAQTPANAHNMTGTLDAYMNANAGTYGPGGTGILGEAHNVPATLSGAPFQGAESKSHPIISSTGPFIWQNQLPLANPSTEVDVRRLFALGTCNGCHYFETKTDFLHVKNRAATVASMVSDFLSTDPLDPVGLEMDYTDATGSPVFYNEPRRRACEFLWLLKNKSTKLTDTSGRAH